MTIKASFKRVGQIKIGDDLDLILKNKELEKEFHVKVMRIKRGSLVCGEKRGRGCGIILAGKPAFEFQKVKYCYDCYKRLHEERSELSSKNANGDKKFGVLRNA